MPKRFMTFFSIAGGSLRPVWKGEPGAMRMRKKLSVTTMNSVGMIRSTRRSTKLGIQAPGRS